MKDTYVSIAQMGNCKICGEHKDLRFGSCFKCSEFVLSTKISPVTYKLWDDRNPANVWFASEDSQLTSALMANDSRSA